MNKTSSLIRSVAVAGSILLAAATAQSAYAAAPAGGAAPAARILIIDLRRAIAASKVGQSIQTQVNALKQQAQGQLNSEAEGLKRQRAEIEQQGAILAANVKAQKLKDFQTRAQAFEKKVQERGGLIQGGMLKANAQVEEALGPILQGLMQERGATVLLDRGAVLLAPNAIDVTGVVVQRLDMKMPAVKVELTALPPGLVARQQAAAQAQ
ncbi:Skp family chaperone for outer membrane proteins [Rhizomicrobium palustre]|uniref:Skp family chaperone for outer membrane proteins n=1 Tax=Rhizomicrobium palustre TaxID=189966 RepID=A0A846N1V6_9PROT|nr:OmpH family outer membrane protein [Rhizomicrobium palustre]NIK89593.1 Skp family chaperone for outer membrane proteins [Rhizomicrobium palustre]